MQNVFKLTNKYIILATPLILFSLLSNIYFFVSTHGAKIINIIITLILLLLMTGAFVAGWFNMVKQAVLEKETDSPNEIIKDFITGVGEYFLPSLGLLFVIFLLNIAILLLVYFVGMHYIGSPNVSVQAFSNAMSNQAALKSFLTSLSSEQLVKINFWNISLLGGMALGYFLVILYLPALFFSNKNPFIAFAISIKNIFSKYFPQILGIYLMIFSLNFIISIFTAIFASNAFLSFIITLTNFYFICLIAVGIFYFYHKKFIKPQLGNNVDTYV